MMEFQLEARFLHHIYYHGGCRLAAYTCICACGPNSSVLHYGHAGAPNDQALKDGSMALLDMGAEYFCYCSDITCSYPVNGKFTADQAMVYGAVLEAQKQIFAAMRPGVAWTDMHRLMWRVVLAALRDYGVLVGELEDMLAAGIGPVFMPAGLGHLIGMDTHDVSDAASHNNAPSARTDTRSRPARRRHDATTDHRDTHVTSSSLVHRHTPQRSTPRAPRHTPCSATPHLLRYVPRQVGGYLSYTPPRIEAPGISKLRTARILEVGQVFTVEPGCYFIEALLQPALAKPETARFFDTDVLARFRGTGGVRLEDVVAITASGIDNYTLCPRTIPEVEAVMSGGKWPPAVDEAPWMERRWFTLDRMSGVMVEDRSVKL